jgi:hypothetical protein
MSFKNRDLVRALLNAPVDYKAIVLPNRHQESTNRRTPQDKKGNL